MIHTQFDADYIYSVVNASTWGNINLGITRPTVEHKGAAETTCAFCQTSNDNWYEIILLQ